ncbi:uncharacterized protein EKO05_0000151 [Ascochyta rabiei]|uniref:uncharacterized protein n=1 Tax=Didymella rabiei TaxID=5454 RepID=UPI002205C511|nr:uncharacterized protein EKO05_0000151 [Ascochyta rabiei]UPX09462.1 hypothetical protein EKO05_0000151 [Ascochyta rabiei]
MSELSNILTVPHQVFLILHTAVVFGHKEGIGIGIIQNAATDATQSNTLLREEHKHGIECGQVGAKNVKTCERANMLALVLAMGLARSTLKRQYAAARIKVQSVTVLCSLPAVVEVIKHHRACGTKSLESVVSTEDRSMLRRVLAGVRRLSRYNVQVSVVWYGAEGNTVDAARVEMIARHRKKKACRRRRHERRIMSKNTETVGDEEEDGGSGKKERDGADDREEGRGDSSDWERSTERESSSAFIMDQTGEPE